MKWQNAFLDYKVDLKPRYGEENHYEYNPFLFEKFSKRDNDYKEILNSFLQYADEIDNISHNLIDEKQPYWINGFFPGMDIISLYGFLRKYRPKTYVEIGSGHSTKVAYKAKIEGNLNTHIVSIDPFPRSEIDNISDTIIRICVENMNYDDPVFKKLQKGDILFIDSSHRILPNSDCAFIYNELIPSLPSGVIIHVHDIYLPYDYPQFMCDRLYNENHVLATYLLSNPDYFEILLPNYYVYKHKSIWAALTPIFASEKMSKVERHGGSIWLRKN